MISARQVLSHAQRRLRGNWAASGLVILLLGIGLGANGAIFGIADHILFSPLPVSPDAVQIVSRRRGGEMREQLTRRQFEFIQSEGAALFSGVAADSDLHEDGFEFGELTLPLETARVTPDFFKVLGIRPAYGRFFSADEGSSAVAVLSYQIWQRQLNGAMSILGSTAKIDGREVTIVGIGPKGFSGLSSVVETGAYLPLDFGDSETAPLVVIARSKPGAPTSAWAAGLPLAPDAPANATPGPLAELRFMAEPLSAYGPDPGARRGLELGCTAFLLLGGCLLLVCGITAAGQLGALVLAQEQELSISLALGAMRTRLAAEAIVEALLLVLPGIGLGLIITATIGRMTGALDLHIDLPISLGFGIGWRTAVYAAVLAFLVVVGISLAPIAAACRCDPVRLLNGRSASGRGRWGLRGWLLAAQAAAAAFLLIFAGLFFRSFAAARQQPLGFNPDGVVNFRVGPGLAGWGAGAGIGYYRALAKRARALPGVTSASIASWLPMGNDRTGSVLLIPGYQPAPGEALFADEDAVSPSYFHTMGIPLERGNDFGEIAGQSAPYEAIVSRSMAAKYWPAADPIGRKFSLAANPSHAITVIGVVGDVRQIASFTTLRPCFYVNIGQFYSPVATLQVRSSLPLKSVMADLAIGIRALAPGVPLLRAESMQAALNGTNGFLKYRIAAWATGTLAFIGILLAVASLWTLVAQSVTQRRWEAGVRVALGSGRGRLRWDIARPVVAFAVAGSAVGIALAYVVALAAAPLLGRESPRDGVAFAIAALVMILSVAGATALATQPLGLGPPAELLRQR